MAFKLPDLPFGQSALAPHISAETLEFHYGKHHKAYVDKLNTLVDGTEWAEKGLEDLIKQTQGGIFNNAAQVWNHTFYWNCLSPNGGGAPTGKLLEAINQQFGGFDAFKQQFAQTSATQFGSGWGWLVRKSDGTLAVTSTSNAENPLRDGSTPLLTCDVWEHAYYIDFRNARPKYIDAFWELVNWDFVAQNLK